MKHCGNCPESYFHDFYRKLVCMRTGKCKEFFDICEWDD